MSTTHTKIEMILYSIISIVCINNSWCQSVINCVCVILFRHLLYCICDLLLEFLVPESCDEAFQRSLLQSLAKDTERDSLHL